MKKLREFVSRKSSLVLQDFKSFRMNLKTSLKALEALENDKIAKKSSNYFNFPKKSLEKWFQIKINPQNCLVRPKTAKKKSQFFTRLLIKSKDTFPYRYIIILRH